MTEDKCSERDVHKKFAVDCFNLVWSLKIGTPVELERGEWQISRVYSVLKRSEPALYHAERCLQICIEKGIGDWDIAFAHEAMARAYAAAGQKEQCRKYIELAQKAGEQIKQKEDREYLLAELRTISS